MWLLGTTNTAGQAVLLLPSSSPGTIFQVRAEKAGYQSTPEELTVSSEVVAFEPTSLEAAIQLIGVTTDVKAVEITNLTQTQLTIFDTSVSGFFRGWIDTVQMEGFSDGTISSILEPGYPIDREILKASLVPGLTPQDIKEETFEGQLLIYFRSTELGKVYAQSLPFTVDVSVGGALEAMNCIIIDTPEPFDDVSLSDVLESKKIGIYNRCFDADGDPVELKNLKAEITWTGNQTGDVVLNIKEIDSQDSFMQTLVEGREVTFFSTMKHEGILA